MNTLYCLRVYRGAPKMCYRTICIFNPIIAFFSMARSLVLNVLGAGGLWALSGIIASYNRDLDLAPIFRPIYYVGIGFLLLWQIFEWTFLSAKQFHQEASLAQTPQDQAALASHYPLHFMWSSLKSLSEKCKPRASNHEACELEQQNNAAMRKI